MGMLNGILVSPVRLSEVKTVLGSPASSLAALASSGLCNKWAKYKFVRKTGASRVSLTWKGDDTVDDGGVRYMIASIKIPVRQGAIGNIASGFIHDLAAGGMTWDYAVPSGGLTGTPYRLLDMNGYQSASTSPLPQPPADGLEPFTDGAGTMTIRGRVPNITLQGNLVLSEMTLPSALLNTMPALNTFYLGVLLYKTDMTKAYWRTAINPLNVTTDNKHVNISLVVDDDDEGKWKARAFLSRHALDQNENAASGMYIAAAEMETDITLMPTSKYGHSGWNPLTSKWLSNTQANVRVNAYNYTAGTVHVRNVTQTIYSSIHAPVYTRSLDDLDIAPGEAEVVGGAWTGILYDAGMTVVTSATFEGTTVTITQTMEDM